MSTIRDRLWQQYQLARQSVWERPLGNSNDGAAVRLLPAVVARRETRRPTVLVHGYKDDATIFRPLESHLSEMGLKTYAVTLAPSDCSVPLETLAQQLYAFIAASFPVNQQLDFVGFSLGGIVARYYVQRMGGLARTGRFLAVATPHHGTWTAFASSLPAAIQLRPHSSFLRDLNADAMRLAEIQFTSLWSPLDLMILPSFNSRLPVGKNLAVWTLRHQWLITGRRGIGAIAKQLTAGNRKLPSPTQPSLGNRPAISR